MSIERFYCGLAFRVIFTGEEFAGKDLPDDSPHHSGGCKIDFLRLVADRNFAEAAKIYVDAIAECGAK